MIYFQSEELARSFGMSPEMFWSTVIILAIWSLVWKGTALWKAARSGDKNWFVALLVLNTLGILEVLYLYVFSKKSDLNGQE